MVRRDAHIFSRRIAQPMMLCRIAGVGCARRIHGSGSSALHGEHGLANAGSKSNSSSGAPALGFCGGSQSGGRAGGMRGSMQREKLLLRFHAVGAQARYYSNDREERSSLPRAPPSVAQKGKYTRGLGLKPEERQLPKSEAGEEAASADRGANLTRFYATCAPGLEDVLAAELASPLIGALRVEPGAAGVAFVGTPTTGYRANLWLRTGVRVLMELAAGPLPLGHGRYDPVYEFVRDAADWASLLVDDSPPEAGSETQQRSRGSNPQSDRYHGSAERSEREESPRRALTAATRAPEKYRFRNFAVQSRVWNCTDVSNSNFASVRAKDAICDSVRDACGGRRPEPPEDGGAAADVPLFLSLYRDAAVLYRDLSGVSLHKRGYRDVMHRASLNEGIAAAILTVAGWNPGVAGFGDANKNTAIGQERVLLDPMCGSGTFLIEAALMASNVAPGLMRRQWPFQTWHDFNDRAWKQCRDAAAAVRVPSPRGVRLLGNDIHEGALSLCKKDAGTAGMLHMLDLSCLDCRDYRPPAVPSLVVTNPPWGSRLTDSGDGEESEWLAATWQALGRFLKAECSRADVYVLSGNADVTRAMHMRADRKWPITVGGQERKLLHYHVLPPKLQPQLLC